MVRQQVKPTQQLGGTSQRHPRGYHLAATSRAILEHDRVTHWPTNPEWANFGLFSAVRAIVSPWRRSTRFAITLGRPYKRG
jgi:hypothetical protein